MDQFLEILFDLKQGIFVETIMVVFHISCDAYSQINNIWLGLF